MSVETARVPSPRGLKKRFHSHPWLFQQNGGSPREWGVGPAALAIPSIFVFIGTRRLRGDRQVGAVGLKNNSNA